jgi:hypothetical protein
LSHFFSLKWAHIRTYIVGGRGWKVGGDLKRERREKLNFFKKLNIKRGGGSVIGR